MAGALEADIVFLDLGMPDLNGYELARMFRKSYRDAPLRLVAVTAYGTPEVGRFAISQPPALRTTGARNT